MLHLNLLALMFTYLSVAFVDSHSATDPSVLADPGVLPFPGHQPERATRAAPVHLPVSLASCTCCTATVEAGVVACQQARPPGHADGGGIVREQGFLHQVGAALSGW